MRKRTRRKVWSTAINPITHAVLGAALIPQDELDRLRIRELAAIEAFRAGKAGLQEWHDITSYLNLCEMLAHQGVGPEALVACETLQDELIEAAHRFEATGKMGLTGPGLVAARDVWEFHDLQRQSVARSVYERAIETLGQRIRNRSPGVVVIT